MYIKKLTLSHFGKFHKKEVTFGPGINVIYGENEAGKSTIHSFMRGIFFGIDKPRGRAGKEDIYTKYQPVDTPASYEGSMEFSYGQKEYRLYRRFYQKEKACQLVDLTLGRELKDWNGEISSLIPGLSESSYRNTISIGQLRARTDAELATEVRNYIANLTTTKASEVDVSKALAILNEKKRFLDNRDTGLRLQRLSEEIEELLQQERQMEENTKTLKVLMNRQSEQEQEYQTRYRKEIQPLLQKAGELPAILQKYRMFEELQKDILHLKGKLEELKKQIHSSHSEAELSELEKQTVEVEELIKKQRDLEEEVKKSKAILQEIEQESRRNRKKGIIPLILGVLLCLIPLGSSAMRTGAGIAVIGMGIIYYLIRAEHIEKRKHAAEQEQGDHEKQNFLLGSRMKEILIRNHSIDAVSLRNKYNELMRQSLLRENVRSEEKECARLVSEKEDKQQHLIYDIQNYMKNFMNQTEVSVTGMRELEEQVREQVQEFDDIKQEYEDKKVQLTIQIDRLQQSLQEISDHENLLEDKQKEYKEIIELQKEERTEQEAVLLAIQAIKELSVQIHDSFGVELSRNVSAQMREITGGRYEEVLVDENLNIKVLYENQYLPMERLSIGTIEQLYFALRLAIAELMFNRMSMTIIMDDSFAFYDDKRMEAVLKLLAEKKDNQILIFTCHHREAECLTRLRIPYTYVEI